MKVALICASPKGKESTSYILLKACREKMHGNEIEEIFIQPDTNMDEAMQRMLANEYVIFFYPLYVDGLPSTLLAFLSASEMKPHKRGIQVAEVCNCGFYEGKHGYISLKIIENWAKKMHFVYHGGASIGAAPAWETVREMPMANLMCKRADQALSLIAAGNIKDNMTVNLAIPRLVYKKAVESNWRKEIRKNGLEARDLDNKVTE